MVFTILAAVDFHQKCNFEFTFPAVPTITELRERLESALGTEAALRRPAGMPVTAFAIHRIQVFDERMEMWVDLVSSSQMADYCQLYVFQRESPWHKDTPGRIPPPVRPSQPMPAQPPYGFTPPPVNPSPQPMVPMVPAIMPTAVDSIQRQVPAYSSSPFRHVAVSPPVGLNPPLGDPLGSVPRLSPPRAGPALGYDIDMNLNPEVITHAEKVRVVFDELDERKARAISYEDWASVLKRLRLLLPDGPFSDETSHDLFHKKADKNEDTFVSFSEFQQFAETYPKMLDSLYFRCRDQVHHDSRSQNIAGAKNLQEELEKRRDEAQQELNDVESQTLSAQQNEAQSLSEVEAAKEVERAARAEKDEAHGQTEEVRGRLRDAQAERERVKESVRQKDAGLRTAQRAVEQATKKEKTQEAELEKAKRELDRLLKLVEVQEKEVERQKNLLSDASDGIASAQSKVGEHEASKQEAEADLNQAQDKVQGIEDELKAALDHETGLATRHRETVKDVNQAQAHKAQEDQELSKMRAKEVQKKAALERAVRALDDHDKVLEALENKDRELQDRRAQEEARENELLEQEVRLREQRETMERKEEALRTAHQDFTNEAGRLSPLRGQRAYGTSLSA